MKTEGIKQTKIKQNRTIRKVVVVLLSALLSFVILSMILSAVIFGVLFKRTQTFSPFEISYSEIDMQKYPRKPVSFYSNENKLQGYIYGTPKSAKGIVIIVNGINSNANSHLPEIMYFVDNGWCAFSYDGTGVGSSEGDGIRGLSQGKIDLESAIDFVKNNKSTVGLPIVLYGHSAGGYASVAILEDNKDIAAVVCIAGFDSPSETMHYFAKQKVGFLADIEYPFMQLQSFFLFGKDFDLSASDAINSTSTPVIIVEADGDTVFSEELGISRFRDKIQNPNVTFLTVDEPYRNQHSTIWFSENAARYISEVSRGGETIDKEKANELDEEFMAFLLLFYDHALQNK